METAQKVTAGSPAGIHPSWLTRLSSRTADNVEAKGWGQLPALSVVMAAGLLLVALADNGGREGAAWSAALHWIGLLILFAPSAVRLCYPNVSRQERIGLLVVLGLGLCLVRVLYTPLAFQFGDELRHWRSAQDILESGHLFQINPSLSVKPFYPGLQNVTIALVDLGGLTTFSAGEIVIVAARLVMVIALYLFYEQVSGSPYIAGIASLLLMTNPHYQSFNAMYVYESLALPLAALVLFSAAREAQMFGGNRMALKLISVLGIVAVTVTHHFTSYALLAFFVLWTIAALFVRRRRPVPVPAGKVLLASVMIVAWIAFVAPATINYFAGPLLNTARDLISVVAGNQSVSNVFRAPVNPLQEQLVSLGAIGLISLLLPLGIWQIRRRYRDNPIALAMAIGSVGYYAILVIRVASSHGSEWAGRSWPYMFVMVAFVLAVAGVEFWRSRRQVWWLAQVVFPAVAIVLFVGGLMSSWPPYWGRLPGPYLVAADERSVGQQGVAAAEWAGAALGRGNRVATDFTNQDLMAAYGAQVPVQGLSWIFFSPNFGAGERSDIARKDVRYFVVDQRLSQALPVEGIYFESGEPGAFRHTQPIAPSALAKFDGFAEISRIFDSGEIKIYDVGAVSHVP